MEKKNLEEAQHQKRKMTTYNIEAKEMTVVADPHAPFS